MYNEVRLWVLGMVCGIAISWLFSTKSSQLKYAKNKIVELQKSFTKILYNILKETEEVSKYSRAITTDLNILLKDHDNRNKKTYSEIESIVDRIKDNKDLATQYKLLDEIKSLVDLMIIDDQVVSKDIIGNLKEVRSKISNLESAYLKVLERLLENKL